MLPVVSVSVFIPPICNVRLPRFVQSGCHLRQRGSRRNLERRSATHSGCRCPSNASMCVSKRKVCGSRLGATAAATQHGTVMVPGQCRKLFWLRITLTESGAYRAPCTHEMASSHPISQVRSLISVGFQQSDSFCAVCRSLPGGKNESQLISMITWVPLRR